jgi:hypothetical protein
MISLSIWSFGSKGFRVSYSYTFTKSRLELALLKEYQVVYLKRGISQRRGHQSKHCSDT